MTAIILEALVLLALMVLNGYFAMSELAVMSARKVRLQKWANEGQSAAQTAVDLIDAPNRFLSTVQIGITLVGVLSGALGGATIAGALRDSFEEIEPLAPYSDALGLGIVVVAITYGSLVIGELVPKRIALQNPEKIAARVARPMRWLARLTTPVVRLLSLSTNLVVRALGIPPTEDQPVTEEEIRLLIRQGTEAGIFRADEQDMIESIFALDDRRAHALMTPHTEVIWLDVEAPPDETRRKIAASGHSRFPVCRGRLDNLLGVVHANDLLTRSLDGQPLDLEAVMRRPRIVPETALASRVVRLLKRSQEHIVIVIDEHGGIQGVITEHDILQAIVGFIPTPDDSDPQAVQRSDGSWLLDGQMAIEDVKEVLGLDHLPDEALGGYQTLGGFIMSQLGEIPSEGACFRWGGFQFEVVDMDGRRVDKIMATPDPDSDGEMQPCP